jgi:hypothetical protein
MLHILTIGIAQFGKRSQKVEPYYLIEASSDVHKVMAGGHCVWSAQIGVHERDDSG